MCILSLRQRFQAQQDGPLYREVNIKTLITKIAKKSLDHKILVPVNANVPKNTQTLRITNNSRLTHESNLQPTKRDLTETPMCYSYPLEIKIHSHNVTSPDMTPTHIQC